MKLVTKKSSVSDFYNYTKGLKKKFVTNYFISDNRLLKWIEKESLYEISIGEVVFLINQVGEFNNLYFFASSLNSLESSLTSLIPLINKKTVIIDIVSKDLTSEIITIFKNNGFTNYTSLMRMSRVNQITNVDYDSFDGIRNAEVEDLISIDILLKKHFDPKAEQLPEKEDLLNWIGNKNIIVFQKEEIIIGFVIFDLKVTTLYLRYWFVHPDYRNLKIGSKLFQELLFRGKDTIRQLFWVIQSNENAIKRYKHYGFKEESMYNFVMINKNKVYEN